MHGATCTSSLVLIVIGYPEKKEINYICLYSINVSLTDGAILPSCKWNHILSILKKINIPFILFILKINRWVGGLMIGATAKDSNCFAFPESLGNCKEVYVWSANKINYNMQLEQEVSQNLIEITVREKTRIHR